MAEELTKAQIDMLRAQPPEAIYQLFISRFPPGYAAQLDFLLVKGTPPESIFEVPSAASIPPAIREMTIAALHWRREQLIAGARNN